MARISCDVTGCDFNSDGGCRLGKIKIDGINAKEAYETVCESFTDKNERGYVDCVPKDNACNNCEIKCDAKDCDYNEDYYCTADRIHVGCADACCCRETECRTFRL